MTRDEFEAVVWQQLGAYATTGIVDRILIAADSYATTEGGITAERRAELGATLSVVERRASVAAMHYLDDNDEPACHMRGGTITSSTALADVTCRHCKRTNAYRGELQLADAGMLP